MTEEPLAVLWREGVEGRCQGRMKIIQGTGRRLTQVGFEFSEGQFNGVEVRAVRWQVADTHPASREQPGDVLDLVGGEVVEDDGVAGAQLRTKHMLKIGGEDLGIDGSFNQKGGFDAFMAQGGNEGGTLPVAVWNGTGTSLTDLTATVQAGQLGVQSRFVDKHQSANIPVGLLSAPTCPGGFNVRPILLGGARRFFYSSGPTAPAGATRR